MPLRWQRLLSRQQWRFRSNRVFSIISPEASPELRASNRKITEFVRNGRLQDARVLFDSLPHRNTVTWNSMLTAYVRRREIAKARKLFDEMPERDIVSWNLMISAYVSCRGSKYLEEARHLFDEMPERDFASWNTLISGFANNGRMDDALRLFDCMPEKNVISWNAMITGFLNNGDVKRGYDFFTRMPSRDAASLCALVSGLIQNGELDEAENLLFKYAKMGNKEGIVYACNTLVAGYGRRGRVEDARRIFDQIPVDSSNVVSWNSMIMTYMRVGDTASARELFDRMEDRDTVTWNTMISGYVRASDMEEATKLFCKMATPDAFTWNSMISGFAKEGRMDIAFDFFARMPSKTRVSWNTVIDGFEKNADYRGAILAFIEMQAEGEKPGRHALCSVLSVCAERTARSLGAQIHQMATKLVIFDVPLSNSLITMYARCGAISDAETVFRELKCRDDVISWNAMIGGYASHGYAKEALQLFEAMKSRKVTPTHVTFVSILSACARGGLVEEGRLYFRSMARDFGIEPRVEHYASLVDVVGRYGKVEEAMGIIESMPVEPGKAVWGALMGACRVHGNVELARTAADKMMRLEPGSSGPYVFLYNMYADAGRWDDALEIKARMATNDIRKERSFSRVDSGGL
ncbi:pentatricopeptide repeat-containing protein At1g62260, mitochondrial [Andrographis paniculata]|uniref:pentatricopeptide repeat-containing protein At1g62260, mitochondrial n=1 Tax=Andrographis paniculata TaxID=175694 RepID=UPI0021E89040|nr:pentatricopeptide repeat-containing protein At1g62260, mitochondrial [Andrographis paniculata]